MLTCTLVVMQARHRQSPETKIPFKPGCRRQVLVSDVPTIHFHAQLCKHVYVCFCTKLAARLPAMVFAFLRPTHTPSHPPPKVPLAGPTPMRAPSTSYLRKRRCLRLCARACIPHLCDRLGLALHL